MRRLSQFGIGILLLASTSTLAAEHPLEPGYFKWLLHLGQNPTDRILHYSPSVDLLEFFGGEAMIRPRPGEIYDFADIGHRSTKYSMIWTPQYRENGFFADESLEGEFVQYYHIYIFSPEQRQARLRFKAYLFFRFWNNGELILDVRGTREGSENYENFLLQEGMNSMTFKLQSPGGPHYDNFLAMRITDRNDAEYTDLTYSLSPPLPEKDHHVIRGLPMDYDPGTSIEVTISIEVDPESTADELTIMEYIPDQLTVVNTGGGSIICNTIQWSLAGMDLQTTNIEYSLAVPKSRTSPIAFLGYSYYDKRLECISGKSVLFEEELPSASDMAGSIETIEINAGDYSYAENVIIEGKLEDRAGGFVRGLKPHQTGGWAEYEFSVTNPGKYHIILDYGELWTMFHHASNITATVDDYVSVETTLYPTTHGYGLGYPHIELWHPHKDPDCKAKWIIASVRLDVGLHRLRLAFAPTYPDDPQKELDWYNDNRPVIKKVIITNYPGLTLPYLAEPHHLDSYEHAPARIVHDRDMTLLPDGRVEITFHSTFHCLSQGSEIYFASGHVRPRPYANETIFEIVSIEPEVFHIPSGGKQDFTLVVRSKELVPDDYSELVVVWLQSTPSAPARRPYLFTTAQNCITLPPYRRQEFSWGGGPLFSGIGAYSGRITRDIVDPAEIFIPDKDDLGFHNGRYTSEPVQHFKEQFLAGSLPSVRQVFQDNGWDYEHHGWRSWDQAWSAILASTYWREDNPKGGRLSNTKQAKAYTQRLSENMVFYPVMRRWDWARPNYIPNLWQDVHGMAALAAHVRAAQEGLIDDNEQFRILHNLILPILNSYWSELRTTAILAEDANEGETQIRIARPFYGATGSEINGFTGPYVKIGPDPYPTTYGTGIDVIALESNLHRTYPAGTVVRCWPFREEIELEARDMMSLLAIGASSRDWAVVDETMSIFSEILEEQKIYLEDGSFRNEPGSYGGCLKDYPVALLKAGRLFGLQGLESVSETVKNKLHNALIYGLEFPFSNGLVPHLNAGGCMNQLGRGYHGDVRMLEELFPEDQDNIALYKRIAEQEKNRLPGDIIDNHNFVIHGWGYAMLRSENGSWDRGMETLLSSKYLLSDPGDHVSHDGLGIVVYGLGAILTPRYGYSWIGYLPPFLNQVMVDDNRENGYYGSFWHFDGRKELPCAVAHTGDGIGSSELPFRRSRWDIQFPEYLFDAYFIDANDGALHQYDWCFINMGDLDILIPHNLSWQDYAEFLDDYWPEPGTRGAGERTIASKGPGRIIADWLISNGPWDSQVHIDETLLRNPPEHSGRLRLIMADDSPSELINAQIGWYSQANGEQTLANSQDILAVRKNAVSHAFIDTLEPIADDEEAYVKDIVVVERGAYNQQLVKITTIEGEDWVYLSGRWGARPSRYQPVPSITTDADIVTWRVINNKVTRFYLAGGSFADTPHGSWNFGSHGNHYVADNDGG